MLGLLTTDHDNVETFMRLACHKVANHVGSLGGFNDSIDILKKAISYT